MEQPIIFNFVLKSFLFVLRVKFNCIFVSKWGVIIQDVRPRVSSQVTAPIRILFSLVRLVRIEPTHGVESDWVQVRRIILEGIKERYSAWGKSLEGDLETSRWHLGGI